MFGVCVFWEFNASEFGEMVAKSGEKPVFVAGVNDYCPACAGVAEKVRELAEQCDAVLTVVNCRENSVCAELGMRAMPSFTVVRGASPKYWRVTRSRSPNDWRALILESSGVVVKVDDPSDGPAPATGATSFHLVTSDKDEFYAEFRRRAEQLSMVGCAFTYTLESTTIPVLSAQLSPNCTVSVKLQRPSDVIPFTETNKFGNHHEYDGAEFLHRDPTMPLALLVVGDTPLDEDIAALSEFGAKYCDRIRFGWIKASDEAIQRAFNLSQRDAPYIALVNDKQGHLFTSKRRFADADRDGLFHELLRYKGGNALVFTTVFAVLACYVAVSLAFYAVYSGRSGTGKYE